MLPTTLCSSPEDLWCFVGVTTLYVYVNAVYACNYTVCECSVCF